MTRWGGSVSRRGLAKTCSTSGRPSRLALPRAADLVLDRVITPCNVLADHPRLGRARPEIGDGARMLVAERWLAPCRLTDDGVQGVRVVDGARDLTRLGWPSDDA